MTSKRIVRLVFMGYLFLANGLKAQTSFQTPNVIPPSPAVQNFLRYGEIPVDYSTGVPNISVPLYTVKSRKLELPMSISYHASGIKVDDKASVVGLGWVFNAGGLVAKSIIGVADPGGYGALSWPTADSFNTALANVNKALNPADGEQDDFIAFGSTIEFDKSYKDWSSDRYTYQLPDGRSGIFRYDFHTGQLIKIPFCGLKIQKDTGTYMGGNGIVNTIRITDEKGILYTFQLPAGGQVGTAITNWDLMSIISADKTDTIRLVYKSSENKYYTPSYTSVLELGDQAGDNCCFAQPTWASTANFTNIATPSSLYTSERILDSIISSTTIVKVIDTADRQDMSVGFGKYRVTEFAVYDRFSGSLIKEFDFNQSYFGSSGANNQRLRLDSLSIKGNDAATVETYRFVYENTVQLPPYPESSNPPVFSDDYWGYYNGIGNYSRIPYQFVPDSVINTHLGASIAVPTQDVGDRTPNHSYAGAALIKEIRYPTGGRTIFTFEPNYAQNAYVYPPSGYQDGVVGGFRILQIKNYSDSTTLADFKTYTYSIGNTRTINADLFSYDQRYFYDAHGTCGHLQTEYRMNVYFGTPFLPLICDNGPPVLYNTVTEYIGDSTGDLGKTVYFYDTPPTTTYATYDQIRLQDPFEYDRGNYVPKLLSKTIYKKENGVFIPIKESDNFYTTFKTQPFFTGIHLVETSTYPHNDWGSDYIFDDIHYCPHASVLGHPYFFNLYDLHATQEINLLTKTVDYDYGKDTSQHVITTSLFTYDTSTHLQPIKDVVINSRGDSLITFFKYPIDFTGTAPYDTMQAHNMIGNMVEEDSYVNSFFQQSMKQNFHDWGNNMIALQTEEGKKLSNSSEVRLRYNAYDTRGNLLSVQKENDMKTVYLWDYNGTYPIAQTYNADTGSVAYTSFESDGIGNWTIGSSSRVNDTSITGSKSYNLSNGSISRSGLNTSRYYRISYWTQNGSAYSITGTTGGYPKQGKTINGWTYFEHRITGQSSVSLSGSGKIDELRLFPDSAQMITYTYKPSIGMTSSCPPTNAITYYEYDNFGRLKLIRDQDRNVVKVYCYNLSGQSENCTVYSNAPTSQTYVRCNCGINFVGSQVAYSVPAYKYFSFINQSDADAQALSEITSNGQNNANSNGTCTSCTGSFSVGSGWLNYSQSVAANSCTESFTLVMAAQSPSSWTNITSGVQIGTINTCSRPYADRAFSCSENGRLWSISVKSNGQVWLTRTGGAALPNTGQGFTLTGTISF